MDILVILLYTTDTQVKLSNVFLCGFVKCAGTHKNMLIVLLWIFAAKKNYELANQYLCISYSILYMVLQCFGGGAFFYFLTECFNLAF